MNWSKSKSIVLSQGCLVVFAVLLLALDVGGWWLSNRFFVELRGMSGQTAALLMAALYLCSVFAWPLLFRLWKLLSAIRRGEVFTAENVARLRAVSWCCVGAAVVCLAACVLYLPFLFVSVAAAFMALIVRIVKNVFQQANAMKSELDLTI